MTMLNNSNIWDVLEEFELTAEAGLSDISFTQDSSLNQSFQSVDSYDTFIAESITPFPNNTFMAESITPYSVFLEDSSKDSSNLSPDSTPLLHDSDLFYDVHATFESLDTLLFMDCENLLEFKPDVSKKESPSSLCFINFLSLLLGSIFTCLSLFATSMFYFINDSYFGHMLFSFFISKTYKSEILPLYLYAYIILSLILRLQTSPFFCNHIFHFPTNFSKTYQKQKIYK